MLFRFPNSRRRPICLALLKKFKACSGSYLDYVFVSRYESGLSDCYTYARVILGPGRKDVGKSSRATQRCDQHVRYLVRNRSLTRPLLALMKWSNVRLRAIGCAVLLHRFARSRAMGLYYTGNFVWRRATLALYIVQMDLATPTFYR